MMQATEPHAPTNNAVGMGQSLLRTLLVCDLVDSTALVERIGDREAANLLRKHDRLARALLEQHEGR
jgi:class 3 adenylate cyclase